MYKLVITSGSGKDKKVESKGFWMTTSGLHSAEEEFEAAKFREDVVRIMLWREDINGVHDLKRWERE